MWLLPFTAAVVLYHVSVKRRGFGRAGRSKIQGRQYLATVEITYTIGTLPDDVRHSLFSALTDAVGTEDVELSWSLSSDPYSRLTVSAALAADRPLTAITRLDRALDEALSTTGLAEEFDVTGRVLHVAPADHIWRSRADVTGF
jgi:hypothetical protein